MFSIVTFASADASGSHFATPYNTGATPSGLQSKAFTTAGGNSAVITSALHGFSDGVEVVYTTNGTVSLFAGDHLELNATSVIKATSAVFLRGDFNEGGGAEDDGLGSDMNLNGRIEAPTIDVGGGGDPDNINLFGTLTADLLLVALM